MLYDFYSNKSFDNIKDDIEEEYVNSPGTIEEVEEEFQEQEIKRPRLDELAN